MRSLWPRGGLWRHPDFLKLWSAETISLVGTQISQLAIPLAAILVLDASAFEVAVVGVAEFLPFLLFALPAGVWVDRLRRRPILVIADVGRGLALATIPLFYAFDALTIWQLYVVGFVVGTLTVFFDVAYQSYLPSLVCPRAARGRQLEARGEPLRGLACRAGDRWSAGGRDHGAVRHPRRCDQLLRSRVALYLPSGDASHCPSGRKSAACARSSWRACATCSAIATGGRLPSA